jgi:ferredoxin
MMIEIYIEELDGQRRAIEVPTDMGLSLMEVLKAYDYHIQATCGGMALCATCHIEVLEGGSQLSELNDNEMAALDSLPDADGNSRLACQVRPDANMDGLVLRIKALQEV